MRKLIYAINLTLDGCFDHTNMVPYEDVFDYYIDLVQNAGAFVYGRKTYQLMVPYWPDVIKDESSTESDIEFAEAFCAVDKMVVFSRTLEKAEEENTEIIHSNLYEEVLKLKQQEGKYILAGGVDIPSQLIALGLVDEYHFVIYPIFAGKGKRLFEGVDLAERLKLKLVDTKVWESGCVLLRYVKG
ncbi:MAG: dihydrofolate reductase family protein [Bacteroidetes bacterium]|jgi:dihydrofolate reductase|nr:dihydrofolate reductase family protein [Bacteroidota bacterium]